MTNVRKSFDYSDEDSRMYINASDEPGTDADINGDGYDTEDDDQPIDYYGDDDPDQNDPYGPDGFHGYLIDGVGFADGGTDENPGKSSLRAATPRNQRNLSCPTCRQPNRLTPLDVQAGYQCDTCADKAERGIDY